MEGGRRWEEEREGGRKRKREREGGRKRKIHYYKFTVEPL